MKSISEPSLTEFESFWRKVLYDSSDLETPIHYKQCFKLPSFTEEEVKNTILNWQKEEVETAKSAARVFVEGGLNYGKSKWMYMNPPKANENLRDYFDRIFEGKKYGLFLSQIDRYNETIAKDVAKFMKPLANHYGFPQFRFTLTFIIGNYDYTPFGIHHDADVGRTLHFIIGDGQKTLTFWKRAQMFELMNSKDRTFYEYENIEKLLPDGVSHTIKANDFYLLPVHHYHVGFVEDFTIDLVVTFRRMNTKGIIYEALDGFYHKIADHFSSEPPSYDINQEFPINVTPIDELIASPTWFSEVMEDRKLRLESNLGYRTQPLLEEPHPLSLSDIIQGNDPFKIIYAIKGENLDLYVRGRDIKMFNDACIITLIEDLNNNKTLRVQEIVERLALQGIEQEDTFQLIQLLYKYSGIKIKKA